MNDVITGGAVSGASIEKPTFTVKKVTASPSPAPSLDIENDTGEGNRVSSGSAVYYISNVYNSTTDTVSGQVVTVENLAYIEKTIKYWNGGLTLLVIFFLCFLVYKFFNIFF